MGRQLWKKGKDISLLFGTGWCYWENYRFIPPFLPTVVSIDVSPLRMAFTCVCQLWQEWLQLEFSWSGRSSSSAKDGAPLTRLPSSPWICVVFTSIRSGHPLRRRGTELERFPRNYSVGFRESCSISYLISQHLPLQASDSVSLFRFPWQIPIWWKWDIPDGFQKIDPRWPSSHCRWTGENELI